MKLNTETPVSIIPKIIVFEIRNIINEVLKVQTRQMKWKLNSNIYPSIYVIILQRKDRKCGMEFEI